MTRPDGFYADIATEREAEQREKFETGIKSINFPLKRKGEGYRSPYTGAMWLAYQAGHQDGCASKQEEREAEEYILIGYIQHGAIPIDPRGADTIYMVSEEGFDGCTVPVFTKAVINKGE